MQHIISDAQSLCTRLKSHESLADKLISQAQSLYKQVDAMKQYQEEVTELNDVAHQKPRDALVQGIQQENRHLRELQQENKELRNSLEEHQSALEFIMSKYRQQVTRLMEIKNSDRGVSGSQLSALLHQSSEAGVDRQAEKITEMVAVMRQAIQTDENNEFATQQKIAQLVAENKGLREMLRVAYSYNGDLMPGRPEPAASGDPAGDDAGCSSSSAVTPADTAVTANGGGAPPADDAVSSGAATPEPLSDDSSSSTESVIERPHPAADTASPSSLRDLLSAYKKQMSAVTENRRRSRERAGERLSPGPGATDELDD